MKAIYKRELRSYFTSMIGYVFVAAGLFFIGYNFIYANLANGWPYFSYSLSETFSIFSFLTPLLTMKAFAEERRNKTDQLLLTYPLKITSMVLGKFLAMLTVYAIPYIISIVCPIIISFYGESHLLSDYMNLLVILLMGGMFVAIGMYVSSKTESQIIAAVITLIVFILIFWWDNILQYLPGDPPTVALVLTALSILAGILIYSTSKNLPMALAISGGCVLAIIIVYIINSSVFDGALSNVLSKFSCTGILYNFSYYYVFDIAGVFFILSVTVLFLFLTCQSIQRRRWN